MQRGPWLVQIIDDEIVILMAVSRAYRDKQVDIITAANAEQALAQMEAFNFDLFLLDLDIKNCCGFALLRTMTEKFPEIPVILMTTKNTQNPELLMQIEQARPLGCWHLLEKPFDYNNLKAYIDRGFVERFASCTGNDACEVASHEQRRCRRFSRYESINISLPLSTENPLRTNSYLATLTDISVGGIGLTTKKALAPQQAIRFDEKFMHQSGIVVWSHVVNDRTCRAGIRFT